MVSRYFSSIMAHSTIRKSDVRSASFSAIALPVSPGSAETAADAAVEAAVSFITVACFSFKYSMLVRCVSGVTEKFEKLLSNVIEALAVLIVTSCVLPVLVLLFLLWIVKMLTGIDFNLPKRKSTE